MDKKAREILFKTYWSSAGWIREPVISTENYQYALKAGYMFERVELSHDDIVAWLLTVRKRIKRKKVTHAFLASLSTRRLDLAGGKEKTV